VAATKVLRWSLPLAIFAVVLAFLFVGLFRDPREVPSPLIGKPAPDFSLARLHQPESRLTNQDMRGQVWLLNVWASWCVACREEHPVLVALSKDKAVPIVGLNYKEVRGDGEIDARKIDPAAEREMAITRARQWLASHGDPYTTSVLDLDGRVGIDFGVYGVPETFVIDKKGVIRYKQIGPITPEALEKTLMPLIRELNA